MDEIVQTKTCTKKMCPIMIDEIDYKWLKTKPRGYLTNLVRTAITEAKAKEVKIPEGTTPNMDAKVD